MLALIMSLGGWFLPREKMLRVHVHDPVNYINTGTITPGKSPIKPRWWKFTFNNYICRKQFSKLFPSFEDCIKTKFVVTLVPRPDISGKGLALKRQFAIDPGLPQVICIVLPL